MDVRTIFICQVITDLFLTIFMLIIGRSQKTYPGYIYWLLSIFSMTVLDFLFALRGIMPGFISIFVGSFLQVFVGSLRVIGMRKFFNMKTAYWHIPIGILLILSYAYFYFVHDSIIARTIASVVYINIISNYLGIIMIINRNNGSRLINLFNSSIFFLFSLVYLARCISWILNPQDADILKPTVFNELVGITNIVFDLAWITMFFAMNSNRLAKDLHEKNQELETSNSIKNRFFAIIAHDLRNPLSGINDFTSMLSNSLDDKKIEWIRERLDIIKNASRDGRDLLENLLKWSETQIKGIKTNPANYLLLELVNKNTGLLRHEVEVKNLKLNIDISSTVIFYGDYDMIDLVVRNILSNAIKFSRNDGNITLKGWFENRYVILSIADEGIGLIAVEIEKLFKVGEKFVRKGTAGESGSGIGLILCKEYMDLNKGKITVESRGGKGTEFRVSIPAGKTPD